VLKTRFITALVLAPVALLVLFWFPLQWFLLAIDFVLLLGAWEWTRLAGFNRLWQQSAYIGGVALALLVFHLMGDATQLTPLLLLALFFWGAALIWVLRYPQGGIWDSVAGRLINGLLVLLPVWVALGTLKSEPRSDELILMLLLLVWAADIGAYFFGKTFGKNKLAPEVSPGKTREGLYGGLLCCLVVGAAYGVWFELDGAGLVYLMLLSLVVGSISVLGDLFESMLKRNRGIKDSSQLLPGHGGVLDRLDSLTAAAPLFVLGVQFLNLS
jgi:phosphatidate cytidylyltransferase